MSFEEVLEYLVLDNFVQWHIYTDIENRKRKYFIGNTENIYKEKDNIYVDEDKINKRIIELQQKFITPYVIDNTEKSE